MKSFLWESALVVAVIAAYFLARIGYAADPAQNENQSLPSLEVTRYLAPEVTSSFSLTCDADAVSAKDTKCTVTRAQNGMTEFSETVKLERAQDIVNRFFSRLPASMIKKNTPNQRFINEENQANQGILGVKVAWKAQGASKASNGLIALSDIQHGKVDPDRDLILEALNLLDREVPGARK